jgi:hypothetical protein
LCFTCILEAVKSFDRACIVRPPWASPRLDGWSVKGIHWRWTIGILDWHFAVRPGLLQVVARPCSCDRLPPKQPNRQEARKATISGKTTQLSGRRLGLFLSLLQVVTRRSRSDLECLVAPRNRTRAAAPRKPDGWIGSAEFAAAPAGPCFMFHISDFERKAGGVSSSSRRFVVCRLSGSAPKAQGGSVWPGAIP